MHSYKLESIPWFNSYYSPDRLLLIPRNPIVNIYFKTPIPTIKFGRIKWPGICVLMDSNETDPAAPRFIWEHYANNENYLFMALEEADVIEVGPQTGIGFRPHVAE